MPEVGNDGQELKAPEHMKPTQEDLIRADEARQNALLKADIEALDALFADDLIYSLTRGHIGYQADLARETRHYVKNFLALVQGEIEKERQGE